MDVFTTHEEKRIVPLWVNGQLVNVQTERTIEVKNASRASVVHWASSADESDAKAAIDAATSAFISWSRTPLTSRREILLKAADVLLQRAEDIDAMQMLETSSPPKFGLNFAFGGAASMREIASIITLACSGDMPHSDDDNKAVMIMRQPVGPILFISPWNSPTYLATRGIATALAAGCTVVLKASELCPATHLMLCQVFAEAGVPAGVLNQIVVGREDASRVTETIISDRRIRKVEFIGSATVGSAIGQLCGKYLKPILMELGGKCPAIICKDADLPSAAKACAFGAFLHHGQICMSTERIIVAKDVAEEFSQLLVEETNAWAAQSGYAATADFLETARRMVEEAIEDGAELLVGDNTVLPGSEAGLWPTILSNVPENSRLRDAESFGPSASLFVVDTDEEAIELANESNYGLGGAIWTRDTRRAIAMSRRLECGLVNINGATIVTDIPPTGFAQATKGSGWGAVNGISGIREFLVLKAVIVQ